ncbi:LLM class flavin-dependent oxidoreductase [Pseudomonas typographi]|uniref:LLM class flavin-dependent oxidoreductase n=1 Tax=Pseudomonas typographi TaxID=2715964 RepID=A0ABR7YWX6_9PSED|nr:LLM class flavin-dependent oxidoreductase [Pseudomonas typographi]MBD1586216.1 LLM class flavin-dependent oxidoreductase [Pseudomonas typographi]MBD1597687.1 LLM class flavin-dependent oxidoreductase [Pseudomonas typographi]
MALEFSWQLPLCSPNGATPPGQWIQLAQAVEYAGLDGLWVLAGAQCAESLGVAAALCAHTHQVQLTVSVAPQVMLPAALFSTLQSLQSISAHRVRLHLPDAEQGELRSLFGEWLNRDQRSERTGEYLEILAQLLNGSDGGLHYSGRYFQLENAGFARRDLPAPPIILDASQSPSLIARHADACLLRSAPGPQLKAQISRLSALQRPAKRALRFACGFSLIQGDSEAQAWEAAARQLSEQTAARLVPADSPPRLGGPGNPLRHFEIAPNLVQLGPGLPLYLIGTPRQLATRLQELHGLGLNHVVIQGHAAVSDVLRFGERVLPLLAELGLRKEAVQHAR